MWCTVRVAWSINVTIVLLSVYLSVVVRRSLPLKFLLEFDETLPVVWLANPNQVRWGQNPMIASLIFTQFLVFIIMHFRQESRAVARKPRDAAAVLFGLKFADDIHCKFKSSQASKARLQSYKHTGTKQNLTQNGDSGSFKVTCFGVSGNALSNTRPI